MRLLGGRTAPSVGATLTQLLTVSLNGLSCQWDDPAEMFNLQPEVYQAAICQTHLRDFLWLCCSFLSSFAPLWCAGVRMKRFTEELQKAETKLSETLKQRRSRRSICAGAQRRRSPPPPAKIRAAADGSPELESTRADWQNQQKTEGDAAKVRRKAAFISAHTTSSAPTSLGAE